MDTVPSDINSASLTSDIHTASHCDQSMHYTPLTGNSTTEEPVLDPYQFPSSPLNFQKLKLNRNEKWNKTRLWRYMFTQEASPSQPHTVTQPNQVSQVDLECNEPASGPKQDENHNQRSGGDVRPVEMEIMNTFSLADGATLNPDQQGLAAEAFLRPMGDNLETPVPEPASQVNGITLPTPLMRPSMLTAQDVETNTSSLTADPEAGRSSLFEFNGESHAPPDYSHNPPLISEAMAPAPEKKSRRKGGRPPKVRRGGRRPRASVTVTKSAVEDKPNDTDGTDIYDFLNDIHTPCEPQNACDPDKDQLKKQDHKSDPWLEKVQTPSESDAMTLGKKRSANDSEYESGLEEMPLKKRRGRPPKGSSPGADSPSHTPNNENLPTEREVSRMQESPACRKVRPSWTYLRKALEHSDVSSPVASDGSQPASPGAGKSLVESAENKEESLGARQEEPVQTDGRVIAPQTAAVQPILTALFNEQSEKADMLRRGPGRPPRMPQLSPVTPTEALLEGVMAQDPPLALGNSPTRRRGRGKYRRAPNKATRKKASKNDTSLFNMSSTEANSQQVVSNSPVPEDLTHKSYPSEAPGGKLEQDNQQNQTPVAHTSGEEPHKESEVSSKRTDTTLPKSKGVPRKGSRKTVPVKESAPNPHLSDSEATTDMGAPASPSPCPELPVIVSVVGDNSKGDSYNNPVFDVSNGLASVINGPKKKRRRRTKSSLSLSRPRKASRPRPVAGRVVSAADSTSVLSRANTNSVKAGASPPKITSNDLSSERMITPDPTRWSGAESLLDPVAREQKATELSVTTLAPSKKPTSTRKISKASTLNAEPERLINIPDRLSNIHDDEYSFASDEDPEPSQNFFVTDPIQKVKMRVSVTDIYIPPKADENGQVESEPAWQLVLDGLLLDENGAVSNASSSKKKFSSYFKRVLIELDRSIYGSEDSKVQWTRTPHVKESDGFIIRRPLLANRNLDCSVYLTPDYQPMQFKLEPRLGQLLGFQTQCHSVIVSALRQYIKTHRLQQQGLIKCDKSLEQIFGVQQIKSEEIPSRLHPLLSQPDPLVIKHTIRLNGPEPKNTSFYEIDLHLTKDCLERFPSKSVRPITRGRRCLSFTDLTSNEEDRSLNKPKKSVPHTGPMYQHHPNSGEKSHISRTSSRPCQTEPVSVDVPSAPAHVARPVVDSQDIMLMFYKEEVSRLHKQLRESDLVIGYLTRYLAQNGLAVPHDIKSQLSVILNDSDPLRTSTGMMAQAGGVNQQLFQQPSAPCMAHTQVSQRASYSSVPTSNNNRSFDHGHLRQ